MTPGTRVRMSQKCKDRLRANKSGAHVNEFGSCTGVVEGLTNWGPHNGKGPDVIGPEVDVRWAPSNLRYAYHPDDLEVV
jgi:hypothetical protein